MSVETITQGLLKNTSKLFKLPQMDLETATEIGEIVNKIENIFPFKVDKLFENALICQILKFKGLDKYSFLYSIVSIPSKDITDIVIGDGFENHENANLQNNAETTHKKAADALFKQYYLNSLPPNLRKLHESGWLHIHDLEYFGTRPFCADLDLRYFFYYGLMPDGRGIKASVSGPAKHVEVAVLHAVKALGASQTNFSGGQGYYNFLTFLAPYFKGLEYPRIKQLMQMFVFEMTQMMVARGGQTVFSSVQLSPGVPKMWQDKPVVACGKVHNGIQAPLWTYGELERENRLLFQALMEVLLQGDYWGKPFSFPKPEILFDHEFVGNLDAKLDGCLTYRELYMMAFNLAAKTGSPYFDNCLPAYRSQNGNDGIKCYQCLSGDELIPFIGADGLFKIKQIEDLFEDASENGISLDANGIEFAEFNGSTPSIDFETLKMSLQPFAGVIRKKYKGKLLNIILNSGRRIKVTPDHPVFVLEDSAFKKKTAQDLKVGEYMPVLKNLDFGSSPLASLDIEKTLNDGGYAYEIIKGEEVNIKNAKKYGLPKHMPITSELIKFLGYYLAEGCSDHSGRRYSVRLSFGKHETDLIEDAVKCINSIGFEPSISVEKTATNIVINSKLLFILLDALGCGHNAHEKSVPDLLFNIEPSLVGQYISCAFKGDGNINIQIKDMGSYIHSAHSIRMRLVSRDAVQRLILLAQRIGIQMNYMVQNEIVKHPHTGKLYPLRSYTCYVASQDQIKKFYMSTGYGATALADSDQEARGALTRFPTKELSLGYDTLTNLINGDIHPLKIKEIEELDYDGYVYDLIDVSNNHNFSNALGIVTGNCCAYAFRSDSKNDDSFDKKLQFEDGKHFSMGAYQVVTLNLPRMAYCTMNYDGLMDLIREHMDKACEIFQIKKKWMDKIRASDRMPFITQHPIDPNCPGKKGPEAVDLSQYTYVIGVVGLNECVKKLTKKGLEDEDDIGFETGLAIIAEMQEYIPELEKKYGIKLSLARTPAETVAGRFAVLDLMDKNFKYDAADVLQGDVVRAMQRIGAGEATMDEPVYYSNGTHLPVSADVPLGLKIKREGAFFPLLSGGDIFHIFLGEENPNPEAIMNMAFKIAQCTDIGYFAFTRDFTVCLSCNRLSAGLKEKCPSCNSLKVDHISRVTGYAQAVSGWNEAKKQELKDRKRYKIWI